MSFDATGRRKPRSIYRSAPERLAATAGFYHDAPVRALASRRPFTNRAGGRLIGLHPE